MLASDSGEMDRALFLLSLGVSLGLEKRDTADTQVSQQVVSLQLTHSECNMRMRAASELHFTCQSIIVRLDCLSFSAAMVIYLSYNFIFLKH